MTCLHIVLVAPLRGEVGLCPPIKDIHERNVVTHVAARKVFVRIVSKHLHAVRQA